MTESHDRSPKTVPEFSKEGAQGGMHWRAGQGTCLQAASVL
jgi:hypothetical protein